MPPPPPPPPLPPPPPQYADLVLDGLRRSYEDRVACLGRGLQQLLEALPRDPIVQQLARDSRSAVHITAHVEGVLRSAVAREGEAAVSAALHRAAEAEARAVGLQAEVGVLTARVAELQASKTQAALLHRNAVLQLRGGGGAASPQTPPPPQAAAAAETQQQQQLSRELLAARAEVGTLREEVAERARGEEAAARKRRRLRADARAAEARAEDAEGEAAALRAERGRTAAHCAELAEKMAHALGRHKEEEGRLRREVAEAAREKEALKVSNLKLRRRAAAAGAKASTAAAAAVSTAAALPTAASTSELELRTQLAAAEAELRRKDARLRDAELRDLVDQRVTSALELTGNLGSNNNNGNAATAAAAAMLQQPPHQQPQEQQEAAAAAAAVAAFLSPQKTSGGASVSQAAALEARLAEREEELQAVTEQAKTDLKDMSDHLKKICEAKREAEAACTELRIENNDLARRLELREEQHACRLEAQKCRSEMEAMREKLAAAEATPPPPPPPPPPARETEDDGNALAEAEQLVHRLQADAGSAREELGEKATCLQAAEQHLRVLQDRVAEAEGAHRTQVAENAKLVARAAALEEAVRLERGRRTALEPQLSDALAALHARAGEVGELRTEVQTLRQAEETLRGAVQGLEASLVELAEARGSGDEDDGDDARGDLWRREHQELVELRVRARHLAGENESLRARLHTVGGGGGGALVPAAVEESQERALEEREAVIAALRAENADLEGTMQALQSEAEQQEAATEESAQGRVRQQHQLYIAAVNVQVCCWTNKKNDEEEEKNNLLSPPLTLHPHKNQEEQKKDLSILRQRLKEAAGVIQSLRDENTALRAGNTSDIFAPAAASPARGGGVAGGRPSSPAPASAATAAGRTSATSATRTLSPAPAPGGLMPPPPPSSGASASPHSSPPLSSDGAAATSRRLDLRGAFLGR